MPQVAILRPVFLLSTLTYAGDEYGVRSLELTIVIWLSLKAIGVSYSYLNGQSTLTSV